MKGSAQIYWLCTWKPTTFCDREVDEWTDWRKKKPKENSRMNKWQHTIPHSSLTWASQGRIILLRMRAACLGNGVLSISSLQLQSYDQCIWKITVKWLVWTLPGSGNFYPALSNVRPPSPSPISAMLHHDFKQWIIQPCANHLFRLPPQCLKLDDGGQGRLSRVAINGTGGGALATDFPSEIMDC